MNKYQKAWENIKSLAETSDYFQHRFLSKDVADLQLMDEFMKHQEPKERCRDCDECEFLNYNYCHNCGNEFGWVD